MVTLALMFEGQNTEGNDEFEIIRRLERLERCIGIEEGKIIGRVIEAEGFAIDAEIGRAGSEWG